MSAFGITFTHTYEKETKDGPRLVRTGLATPAFWQAWRAAGGANLAEQGFYPRKLQDRWYVDNYMKPSDPKVTKAPLAPIEPLRNAKGLLPYQVPHTAALVSALRRLGSALDASDPGTGKTYAAVAAARETRLIPAVVCPKSVIGAWKRVLAAFGIEPVFVMNWEGCKSKGFPHGDIELKTDDYTWKLSAARVLLIFDEAHKAKGEYSQNAKMVIAAKEQKIPMLLLSGTIAMAPSDMRALGFALGIHSLSDFRQWVVGMGSYRLEGRDGWGHADAVEAMRRLHDEIFPMRGSRMRIADLGDAFPPTQITSDLYPISKAKQQNEAYDDLVREIKSLKAEKKEGWRAASMVLNLRYRQLTELLKLDLLAGLAKDGHAVGLSVMLFVNFRNSLHTLKDLFPKASWIHGLQSDTERQAEIDRFQADEARTIICQMRAGGVGVSLHDERGVFPRLSLIAPTYSAIDLRQVLGRPHRATAKSKSLQRLVYAEGTIEEKVCETVALRLKAISSLNDGDLLEKDILGVLGSVDCDEDHFDADE